MTIPTLNAVPGHNIYIGGFIALRRPKALANCHITHIVSVLDWEFGSESQLIKGYQHLHIPVDDVEDENLLTWFPRSNAFIEQALKKGGEKDAPAAISSSQTSDDHGASTGPGVLVHCAMGKSRSATIIIAYLLWSSRRTHHQSLAHYRSKLGERESASTTTASDGSSPDTSKPNDLDDHITIPPKPLTVEEALMLLRRGRPLAEPNEGFMDQLHLYHQMGCPDDVDSHKLYKRWLYKRSVAESLSINRAPDTVDIQFEDEDDEVNDNSHSGKVDLGKGLDVRAADGSGTSSSTALERKRDEQLQIKCRRCRHLLSKGSFVMEHEPQRGTTEDCAHIFLHPLSWMKPALAEGRLDGRLTCPNPKCGANVGKFAWQGFKCNCGAWITPAFGMAKGRVDEVRPHTNTNSAVAGQGIRMPPGTERGSKGNL